MWHLPCPAVGVWLFCGALACAQTYPGQYPPAQYPPGQYPPGQYPPGQYPNTYPTRLPGGIPVGIPVPELKLPKKQPKTDKPAETPAKTTVASVSGSLRKLAEKDLLLQTSPKTVLRLRLLVKTQFRNKEGAAIRDSLLHPGDQLSVDVSPDDEETALRVVLLRSGTPAERKAAEVAVEESAVRAPRADDLGKPRTMTAEAAASESAEAAPASPTPAPVVAPGGDAVPPAAGRRDALPASDEQIVDEARAAAGKFTATLPDFLAEQVTTRYFATGFPVSTWQTIDTVTATVAYVNGKEDYRDIRVNGTPTTLPPERTGSWSTGEFGTTLEDLMSPATNAAFQRRGDERKNGRPALVYAYTVEQPRSHWTIVSPDGRRHTPAYEGTIWIDRETRRVLRIEQRTSTLPPGFPYSRVECVLDYGFERIDQGAYLLPAASESMACMSGSGACTRNAIQFRNYRKFTADSVIKYLADK
jgi:hypothetical protein